MSKLWIPIPVDDYTQYVKMVSDKYYTFPLPFSNDLYTISTFGDCPFVIIAKHKTGCMLRFDGPSRLFVFSKNGRN